MAQIKHDLLENEHQQDPPFSFDDSLYCQEEHWEGELREEGYCFSGESYFSGKITSSDFELPNHSANRILFDQDLCWEDHELSSLLSKEEENKLCSVLKIDPCLAMARREAVDWILRVHTHFSFSAVTAFLAVSYLDRFFFSFKLQNDKPWLTQLVAVACLSIAAKFEETHVPLLLDFQVEESKYLFEAKTIQRMEVLVLSTLEWKMSSVTPHSFLDYMTRRLGLKHRLCWEFLRRCEMVLLATVSDVRFMGYLPSVVASATMLHVISSVEPSIEKEYQSQLLGILGADRDQVEECGELISELAVRGKFSVHSNKRKSVSMPGSPNGVIDVSFSSDSSNDSWAVASSSSSVSSSPEPLAKKMRVDQDELLTRDWLITGEIKLERVIGDLKWERSENPPSMGKGEDFTIVNNE
ncbi:hypothetical protein V2J09_023843 [Rumex salicifolius]